MSKPRTCPNCGSYVISYLSIAFDSENNRSLTAHCCCHDCGRHFTEHYKTKHTGSALMDYDPWDGPMSAPVSNSSSKKTKSNHKAGASQTCL